MIDIVEGKSIDIEDLAGLVQRHPEYNYKVIRFCELSKLFVFKKNFKAANRIYVEIEKFDFNKNTSASMMINYVKGVIINHNQGFSQQCLDYVGKAAKLAFKLNNHEYQLSCYQTLGLWLNQQDNLYEALGNFIHGFDVLYKITTSIPSGFKESYLKSLGRYGVKNNLIGLINRYYNKEPYALLEDGQEECFDDAGNFFEDKRIQRILMDQQFQSFVFRNKSRLLSKPINDLEELLKQLRGNYSEDIETTLKFAADLTLADRGYIFIKDQNNQLRRQYSAFSQEDDDVTAIIREIEAMDEAKFEYNPFGTGIQNSISHGNKRGKIIIPLYKNPISHHSNSNHNQRDKIKDGMLYGYIYLDTVKIFNNFSDKNFATIKTVGKLLLMLIENHDFKIDSSLDKMTGVYARKYFDNAIKEEVAWARENNTPLSLILFDIDFFKTINDNYGHQKGDEVLRKLCQITLSNIRKTDILCRYGGEEFAVILPNTDIEEGFEAAERIREAVEKTCTIGNNCSITISIGISSYPEDGILEEELITKADQALYYAKETGKNRCCRWNSTIAKGNRRADKLAGIITGNPLLDQRNILVITEIIALVREELTYEQRVYKILGKIIDILGAQRGMLITFDHNNIHNIYGRERAKEEWTGHHTYNQAMIDRIVQNMSGEYYIDWENMSILDAVTKKPLWQSVIGVPVIRQSKILGIIYLSVPIKEKEFDFNSFNFLNLLSRTVATVI
jgi:diguanylate cyclase (GGDEF)-like protein